MLIPGEWVCGIVQACGAAELHACTCTKADMQHLPQRPAVAGGGRGGTACSCRESPEGKRGQESWLKRIRHLLRGSLPSGLLLFSQVQTDCLVLHHALEQLGVRSGYRTPPAVVQRERASESCSDGLTDGSRMGIAGPECCAALFFWSFLEGQHPAWLLPGQGWGEGAVGLGCQPGRLLLGIKSRPN